MLYGIVIAAALAGSWMEDDWLLHMNKWSEKKPMQQEQGRNSHINIGSRKRCAQYGTKTQPELVTPLVSFLPAPHTEVD